MGEVERSVARSTGRTDPLDPAHVLWRWWTTVRLLDAAWLVALGSTLFLGGRARLGGPSLHGLVVISDRLGWDARVWAVAPVAAGLALASGVLADRFWARTAAYVLATLFSLTFAAGGLWAIPTNPTASATAIPTYLFTAALQLAFLYASVQVSVLNRVR